MSVMFPDKIYASSLALFIYSFLKKYLSSLSCVRYYTGAENSEVNKADPSLLCDMQFNVAPHLCSEAQGGQSNLHPDRPRCSDNKTPDTWNRQKHFSCDCRGSSHNRQLKLGRHLDSVLARPPLQSELSEDKLAFLEA